MADADVRHAEADAEAAGGSDASSGSDRSETAETPAVVSVGDIVLRIVRYLRPVRVRIALAAMVVTGVALVVASWVLVRSIEDTQLAQIRNQADAELDDLADQLAAGEPELQMDRDAQILPMGVVDEHGDFQPLAPSDGGAPPMRVTIGRSSSSPFDALQSGQTRAQVLQIGSESERVERTIDTPDGEQTLLAALPTDEVSRSVAAVRRSLLLALPALVGLVGLSTWWLVGRALRPVEAIRVEAASIGGRTIHRRVPEPETDDEIGRLARTMNAMLGRLDTSARAQRQFVSDASHELRSPVTTIRAGLEVALSEGDRADWPAVAHDVLAEENQLEQLLGDLLILAADDERDVAGLGADASSPEANSAEVHRGVDLTDLVAAEAERSRRVPVSAAVPSESVTVEGSRSHLTRLVSNLLDNAARHARSQVDVSLRLVGPDTHAAQQLRLLVDDDGPGIPEADRERVFDRFVRLDESRSRDEGGAGLGLAVVRSIARRQGGDVRAARSPLGGARLVVELPVSSSGD